MRHILFKIFAALKASKQAEHIIDKDMAVFQKFNDLAKRIGGRKFDFDPFLIASLSANMNNKIYIIVRDHHGKQTAARPSAANDEKFDPLDPAVCKSALVQHSVCGQPCIERNDKDQYPCTCHFPYKDWNSRIRFI